MFLKSLQSVPLIFASYPLHNFRLRCSNQVVLNSLGTSLPASPPTDRDRMYSISHDGDTVEVKGERVCWLTVPTGLAVLVSLHHLLHCPPAPIHGPGRPLWEDKAHDIKVYVFLWVWVCVYACVVHIADPSISANFPLLSFALCVRLLKGNLPGTTARPLISTWIANRSGKEWRLW